MTGLERELRVGLAAVRQACRLCEDVAAHMDGATLFKEDGSPATIADFGSQALVCRALWDAFPGDEVMAEESASLLRPGDPSPLLGRVVEHVREWAPGANAADVCRWLDRGGLDHPIDRFWILDPIDGTKGFLRGGQYAVALALVEDGEVVLAVLGCPRLSTVVDSAGAVPVGTGFLFWALRGSGTRQQPLGNAARERPARVSETVDIRRARVCEPFEAAHGDHAATTAIGRHLGMTEPPARLDSQAKYGLVARGDGDVYLRLPRQPGRSEKLWDHAAGALVVEQAGGRVTDALGRALVQTAGTSLDANLGVVVTNGHLHEAVLRAIEELDLLAPSPTP